MVQRVRLMSLALLLVSCASAARAQPAQVDREELEKRQKTYVGYLKSEGYSPEVITNGDVAFKYQGGKYGITIDPKDAKYFRVVSAWKLSADSDRAKALAAANKAESGTKVAKVVVLQNTVVVAAEIFLKDPEDFAAVFDRALGSLQLASRLYFEELNKK